MAFPVKNLRHALKSIVPKWLADRSQGLNVGFAVLFVIALMADILIEVLVQGARAAFPGIGTPTALTYIGRSRGIVRGFGESDVSYAEILRQWLDLWPDAGMPELIARLIQRYMGGNLRVRYVERRHSTSSARFTTINPDGTVSVVDDTTWNWDETQFPERADFWSDFWIIVYVTDGRWPIYDDFFGTDWIAAWGDPNNGGTGHNVPRSVVSDVNGIISFWKGAHSYCRSVVFTNDESIFVPGSLGVTFPNGYWANWSRISNEDVQVPARAITSGPGYIRYWIPNNGA